MSLEQEIELGVRQISTDAYEMSVGEVINMYRDQEIEINPAFQRLFRWESHQKSRFIESLLLKIPIPPIFVFERDDGKWELIDGLQRLSTILEFVGVLRGHYGQTLPASSLTGTKYLPSLNGIKWEEDPGQGNGLSKPQQLAVKRARIGVQILQKKSDEYSKYDLFQRLNAGGSIANDQELRNCIIVMLNSEFYHFLQELSENPDFQALLQLNDDQKQRQEHLHMLNRFLVYSYIQYNKKLDIREYLDEGIIELTKTYADKTKEIRSVFEKTFQLIRNAVGDDGLKRFDGHGFSGRVGRVGLETIAVGVACNLDEWERLDEPQGTLEDRIKRMWVEKDVSQFTRGGLRGTQRIQETIPFGLHWFKP